MSYWPFWLKKKKSSLKDESQGGKLLGAHKPEGRGSLRKGLDLHGMASLRRDLFLRELLNITMMPTVQLFQPGAPCRGLWEGTTAPHTP